ncbi:MAG: hypothetical protein LBV79_12310, partial [Candidatus Adiutrix sp.]|nr:hypothetical protein [Candidatus Adiutrix sp.]
MPFSLTDIAPIVTSLHCVIPTEAGIHFQSSILLPTKPPVALFCFLPAPGEWDNKSVEDSG